ncbi:MAG: glycerate kinase [Eubacteriales bacterium]|nr:glycerate kinase [Eubacteriales bacterium]
MKILIASGSFKDVYSPVEACDMIRSSLDCIGNDVSCIPFCDGGEYTLDVLKNRFDFESVTVDHVLNAYGKKVSAEYLINHDPGNGDEAHIVSSCIIRLFPEEDACKNPLILSDYGFGELISDALSRGCRRLVLYFGGTSTASCGMGAFQALGGMLLDSEGNTVSHPCTAADLAGITGIIPPDVDYGNISVHIIGDGNSKVNALPGITGLKVGKTFQAEKEKIVSECMSGIENCLRLTGISPVKDFTGAAGGLLIGLEPIFKNIRYTLGGLYFKDYLDIEESVKNNDLIITGEGRYDNTADGKAPSVIAGIAQKYHKPCILVCGQIEKKAVSDYSGGVIRCEGKPAFSSQGITTVLTSQEYYDTAILPDSYREQIEFFRKETPIQMKSLFRKVGLSK